MKLTNIVLAVALMLGLSTQAFAKGGAGVTLMPSVMYVTNTLKDSTGDTKSSGIGYGGKIGYTLASGLYFGGVFDSANIETDETPATKISATNMGASVGFIHESGFNIIGSYYFSSSAEPEGAGGEFKGSGFALDAGYMFMMKGGWGLGPELSYTSIAYDDFEGVEVDLKGTGISAGLAFLFMF